MARRWLLPAVCVPLLLVACGSDGQGADGPDTTRPTTAGAPANCSDDQLRAGVAYGRGLAQVSDRGEALGGRLAADLNTLTSRALTLDDTEAPAALRSYARQYASLGGDLSALGAPPPSYAQAVAILSKALETVTTGLDTMARGADQKSEATFGQGLSVVTTGFNMLPQASAALDASPLC